MRKKAPKNPPLGVFHFTGEMSEHRGRSPSPRPHYPRHSRWDDGHSKTFVPGIPSYIPTCLSKQEVDALLLRIRIEEIGWKIQNNQFDLQHFRKRSPSPAPSYDAQGKRTNTR